MFSAIRGGVGSGKTTTTNIIIDELRNADGIRVCGYTQPSYFYDGDREGYLLRILGETAEKDTEMSFATVNYAATPGVIPYNFDPKGFEASLNNAKAFVNDKRKTVIILDELGQLEAIKGIGHRAALDQWAEHAKNNSNVLLLFTYNPRRQDAMNKFFEAEGLTFSGLQLDIPVDESEVRKFAKSIIDYIKIE